MAAQRAHYSIVQYVPDDSRAECANVGVVLFVPESRWLQARTTQSLDRVRRFFRPGQKQIHRIELALKALEDRMDLARDGFTEENDLVQFAASRADQIRVSTPRLVMVDEPKAVLIDLYEELVGDTPRQISAAIKEQALPPHVAEVFGRLEAQKRLWRPGKITLPTTGGSFDVPIAFQNGLINYVRPESLRPGRKLNDLMSKLGFSGQLISRHPINDRDGRLVVLSADPDADSEAENRFAKTLKEFSVRFVRYSEIDAFAEEVEQTATDCDVHWNR